MAESASSRSARATEHAPKLVMVAFRPLTIGGIYRGLTDPYLNDTDTAFKVVREATEEEYWTCLREHGQEDRFPFFGWERFYVILID